MISILTNCYHSVQHKENNQNDFFLVALPPAPLSNPDENNFFNLPSTSHPPISGIPLPPPPMNTPPRPLMGGAPMPPLMPPRLPPPPGQGPYPHDGRGPYPPPPHRFMPPPPFMRGPPPANIPPPNMPLPNMPPGPPNRVSHPIHYPSQDPHRMGTAGKEQGVSAPTEQAQSG